MVEKQNQNLLCDRSNEEKRSEDLSLDSLDDESEPLQVGAGDA